MRIVERLADLQLPRDKTIGFVPTMGAFHKGHLELMRTSRQENEVSVVSLFVNPTQFGPNEDYQRYPRQLDRDAEMARSVGVDILFAPSAEDMYPRRTTRVVVEEVTGPWEGAHRPGHFDGVATVVAKLFHLVNPTRAYFGWKDLQQCLTIRRMVSDLNFPIDLRLIDTYREEDGLAMSSRNAYLSAEHRKIAPSLYRFLVDLSRVARANAASFDDMRDAAVSELTTLGFSVEYLEWVNLSNLEPVRDPTIESAILVAARLGQTRLIDNVRFSGDIARHHQ